MERHKNSHIEKVKRRHAARAAFYLGASALASTLSIYGEVQDSDLNPIEPNFILGAAITVISLRGVAHHYKIYRALSEQTKRNDDDKPQREKK